MAKWTVDGDGRQLIIEATIDGRISLDIVPAGEPFTMDADAAQVVRIKIGAAIGIARGGATT